jgi:hypothetical protein
VCAKECSHDDSTPLQQEAFFGSGHPCCSRKKGSNWTIRSGKQGYKQTSIKFSKQRANGGSNFLETGRTHVGNHDLASKEQMAEGNLNFREALTGNSRGEE